MKLRSYWLKKTPYTYGKDIIKPVLEIVAKIAGDKAIGKQITEFAHCNDTVTRRVDDLALNVTGQVKSLSSNSTFFSLAMDESTDISDTAQVAIFIRAINENFEVMKELLGVESMQGTTKGTDLFDILRTCAERNNSNWQKLDSVCTDGAPALTGRHIGCLALLEQYLGRPFLKYHCIIHQGALCAKSLCMKTVMDVVMKCINKIRARALNRREFRQFLKDMNKDPGELLLHCEVRWLSRGKVHSRFWLLRNSVGLLSFLKEINELPSECESLADNDWLNDLAFLVDITGHLKTLNTRLQGSNKLFTNLCNDVNSFKTKLTKR